MPLRDDACVLSFYRFDPASGPIAAFQFGNYAEVLGSSVLHAIFLRTFGIAFLVTLLLRRDRRAGGLRAVAHARDPYRFDVSAE